MGGYAYGYGTAAVCSVPFLFFLCRLYSAAPTSKRRSPSPTTRGTRISARSVVCLALALFFEELCLVCEAAAPAPASDFVGVNGGEVGVVGGVGVGVDSSWCVLWKFKFTIIKTEFLAYLGGAAAVVFGVIGFCVFIYGSGSALSACANIAHGGLSGRMDAVAFTMEGVLRGEAKNGSSANQVKFRGGV
jgi:hypothetical protein